MRNAALRRGHLWDKVRAAEDRTSLPNRLQHRGASALLIALKHLDAVPERSHGWITIKAILIAERGPCCESCEIVMPDPSLVHLHHVIPRKAKGEDTRQNSALLCPNCHARAHWLYRTGNVIPSSRDDLFALLMAGRR